MLLLGDNFFLIRAHSLSSLLFKVTVHFIQGLFRLSEPFKAKFIEEINSLLNTGLSLCTSQTHPA